MTLRSFFILAVCCFASGKAGAFATFGGFDCGQMVADQAPGADPAVRAKHREWLVGFITGFDGGIFAYTHTDPLDKVGSAEQIFQYVENYCREHPRKSAGDGAMQLLAELQRQRP